MHFSRAKKWTVNCRREDLLKKDTIYLNKNCTICSVHFEDVMFLNFLRNRLKPDAVPTLFMIPNPPKQIAQKRKAPTEISSETSKIIKKSKIDVQVIIIIFLILLLFLLLFKHILNYSPRPHLKTACVNAT